MKPRIIFMGTPDFAVPSLQILIDNNYPVVAVITATDKMGGRGGKKLLESPVKKFAVTNEIPVLQPKNLKAPEFIEELASYEADLQIVVAFRMLPEVVWAMPKMGTFNLHGSLLPKYRGAAPINWAVANGDTETGVTTFFIQKEIDTGDLIFQQKTPVGPTETAGDVYQRLMLVGAELVLKTVEAIEFGGIEKQKQDHQLATPAPKLYHEKCHLDFNQSTQDIHNFIRGMSPFPAAWAMLNDQKWKFFRSEVQVFSHNLPPGTLVFEGKKELKIAAADGFVLIHELQIPGKRKMDTASFLNGFRKPEESLRFT